MRKGLTVLFASWALPLLAQETPAPLPPAPKRSLADGLVRQRIEIDRLQPPVVTAGLEVGAGEGPMVLLVRKGNEPLVPHEIERGTGDHGPAAKKTSVGAPLAGREGAAQPKDRPGVTDDVLVALERKGAELAVGTEAAPREIVGALADRAKLREWLQRQFETTRGTRFEGRIHLRVHADVLLQDVLTTWEVARSVGFRTLLIEDRPPGAQATPADRELLKGLAARFDWSVGTMLGVHPVCDAELLFLVDGKTRFGELAGLLRACVEFGYWQIGFVGQQDGKTRWKLPMHIPFDG